MSAPDDLQLNPNYQFCKELCESLDSGALNAIISDQDKTIKIVKENVEKHTPEKINDHEYIESLVTEMQKVAHEILTKKSKS